MVWNIILTIIVIFLIGIQIGTLIWSGVSSTDNNQPVESNSQTNDNTEIESDSQINNNTETDMISSIDDLDTLADHIYHAHMKHGPAQHFPEETYPTPFNNMVSIDMLDDIGKRIQKNIIKQP